VHSTHLYIPLNLSLCTLSLTCNKMELFYKITTYSCILYMYIAKIIIIIIINIKDNKLQFSNSNIRKILHFTFPFSLRAILFATARAGMWEQGSVQGCIVFSDPQRRGEKYVKLRFFWDVSLHPRRLNFILAAVRTWNLIWKVCEYFSGSKTSIM
jgi:hypothetical protein